MRLVLVQPPDTEPVSIDEARARLNIGSDVADEVLGAFITAARLGFDGIDGSLGRALITQTWRGMLQAFPPFDSSDAFHRNFGCSGEEIMLPFPPLQSVNSITYVDPTGAIDALDDSDFQIVPGRLPFIVPAYGKSWPSPRSQPDAVTIEFVVGYGDDGTDVPEPIRAAICLQVSQLRTLSTRDQNVMVDNVIGVSSRTYAVGRDGGADALTPAAQALVANYRIF